MKTRVSINRLLGSYYFKYMSAMYEGEQKDHLFKVIISVHKQMIADLQVLISEEEGKVVKNEMNNEKDHMSPEK